MPVNSVKKVNYTKMNVNDYSLTRMQSNVQQSFDQLTSIIGNWHENLFYAQPSMKADTPISQDGTYIFDTVLQDKYYTYDPKSGKYKCLVDGLYFINVGIYSKFTGSSWDYVLTLAVNGGINSLLSYNNNIPSGNNYMASCSKMMLLNAGDILEIKNEGTNNVLWKIDSGNNIFSYFQVWFIC